MSHTHLVLHETQLPSNGVLCSSSPCTQVRALKYWGSFELLTVTYLGDPTTPGYPAYENATRTEGENIPKIPSLPISWANAQRLLNEISSSEARVLDGKLSARKIKLVNHGMYQRICVPPGY